MNDSGSSLVGEARRLVAAATATIGPRPELERIAARLDDPLRVAIAGRVKAGKSTLLNALVGERLAPTDESECTRIVTWYRDGVTYEVRARTGDGREHQLRFHRDQGAIDVDLGGLTTEVVEELTVTWPSATLRQMTLIDTPGIGSLSAHTSARTDRFISPADEETPADAVLYLMRHLHRDDLDFLEAYHDTAVSRPNPVNAVAVLARADEIGVGRLDAMTSATRIAGRLRREPKVAGLVQAVVPVAGLIAETAVSLTEAETGQLRRLASLAPDELEACLLSTDRFRGAPVDTGLTDMEREQLLSRFGLFGLRLSTDLIRRGVCATAQELAGTLADRSGLVELRTLLMTTFASRADLFKARSALLALDQVLRSPAVDGATGLRSEIERVLAAAHGLQELRALAVVRSGTVEARPEQLAELERLLGGGGSAPRQRLDLPADATTEEVRAASIAAIGTWRRRAENPLSSPSLVRAADIAIRTCEGLAHESDPRHRN